MNHHTDTTDLMEASGDDPPAPPREILVPVPSRQLEQDPRGALGPARFTAETVAADAGWELPEDVAPVTVGTYHEAADLSPWAAAMIAEALERGDDLSDLAFAYWRWEDDDE